MGIRDRYYDLPNQLTVYTANADGSESGETGPLYNTADFETRDKYKAFLRGNNGYSVLEGNGTGSLLIIKDSYANAFIPYLVEDYACLLYTSRSRRSSCSFATMLI